jgi:hypothetical protein
MYWALKAAVLPGGAAAFVLWLQVVSSGYYPRVNTENRMIYSLSSQFFCWASHENQIVGRHAR